MSIAQESFYQYKQLYNANLAYRLKKSVSQPITGYNLR